MRVVGRDKLTEFVQQHADARSWIEGWLAEAERIQWRTPQNIKDRYGTASFLANNVVIFNVRGNNYRLEVQVLYKTSTVLVRWIGTHEEYARRHAGR